MLRELTEKMNPKQSDSDKFEGEKLKVPSVQDPNPLKCQKIQKGLNRRSTCVCSRIKDQFLVFRSEPSASQAPRKSKRAFHSCSEVKLLIPHEGSAKQRVNLNVESLDVFIP